MGNARSVIKRLRFPLDIMLLCVRWYCVKNALGDAMLYERSRSRLVGGDFKLPEAAADKIPGGERFG
jgi:hypothetical protein